MQKSDSAMSRTVFYEAERLDYFEGGSKEMTPESGTLKEKTDRTALDRTILPQDYSASVDHYTSYDNFNPGLLKRTQSSEKKRTIVKISSYKRRQ